MPFGGVALGGRITLALYGGDMEHDRAMAGGRGAQGIAQCWDVVTVDGPDVAQPEVLENAGTIAQKDGLDDGFETAVKGFETIQPQPVAGGLGGCADAVVTEAGEAPGEKPCKGADIARDAHPIVIDDQDETVGGVPDGVEGLQGDAVGQRSIADDSDDILLAATGITGRGETKRGGKRNARVAADRRIIRRFTGEWEPAHAAESPQRLHPDIASGEHLPGVGLMADIPNQFVLGKIKDAAERQRQLHHPQAGRQMAAGLGHHRHHAGADFTRQLRKRFLWQRLDVRRGGNGIKERRGEVGLGDVVRSTHCAPKKRKRRGPRSPSVLTGTLGPPRRSM